MKADTKKIGMRTWIKRWGRPTGLSGCLALLVLAGCARAPRDDRITLQVWAHQGQEAENRALREIAEAFNAAHADQGVRVVVTFFPDHQYTEKISTAAAARDLPDVMELDGPTLAQFVEAGLLQPLDPWIPPEDREDFLDTIIAQGTVGGRLYALGAFDSALVLYYDREMFAAAGVAEPEAGERWGWDDFVQACATLQAAGLDPVAFHMDESADEWYTYAFSPLIWSVGGRLIDVEAARVAGVLDSEENVAALHAWQQMFRKDYAATDPVNPNPFGAGETAMDWNGHWMARSHQEAKGERLGAMPLPLPGPQPAAPCGSWCWAITAQASDAAAAGLWIRWVTDRKEGVLPMVRANGAVPARHSSFDDFPEFEHAPYRVFRDSLREAGRPRPRTPHYPVLTRHVAAALRDIARGADVADRLSAAAREIQRAVDRAEGRASG